MPRRRTSAKKQMTKEIEKPRPGQRERAQPTESNPIAHKEKFWTIKLRNFRNRMRGGPGAGSLISDLSGKGDRLHGLGKFHYISRRGRQ